ncbi:MAG TPA: hypothetical protein VI137_04920 [Pseudolabrys sp.]|jgi:hypothetical protein
MKAKDENLAQRIECCRDEANALIDAEAERMQRVDGPGVPIGVLRQMIMARHQCVCSAALALLDSKDK